MWEGGGDGRVKRQEGALREFYEPLEDDAMEAGDKMQKSLRRWLLNAFDGGRVGREPMRCKVPAGPHWPLLEQVNRCGVLPGTEGQSWAL